MHDLLMRHFGGHAIVKLTQEELPPELLGSRYVRLYASNENGEQDGGKKSLTTYITKGFSKEAEGALDGKLDKGSTEFEFTMRPRITPDTTTLIFTDYGANSLTCKPSEGKEDPYIPDTIRMGIGWEYDTAPATDVSKLSEELVRGINQQVYGPHLESIKAVLQGKVNKGSVAQRAKREDAKRFVEENILEF